jgi:hypothetical protein
MMAILQKDVTIDLKIKANEIHLMLHASRE